jgi:hypothetical protein
VPARSVCELSLTPSCTFLKVKDVLAVLVQEMAHTGSTLRGSSRVHLATKVGLPPAPQGRTAWVHPGVRPRNNLPSCGNAIGYNPDAR